MCILGDKVLILKHVMQLFILQQLKVLVYRNSGVNLGGGRGGALAPLDQISPPLGGS